MPAQNDDGTMLCDDILTAEEFEDRKTKTDPVIIAGNYQQSPYDSHDVLYPDFKTYAFDQLPTQGTIEAYFDTADEGKDFLAGAVYRVFNGSAYILDLIYTQDSMEHTEGHGALMLAQNKCQTAWIESNNGGRAWARNVERIMREISGYTACMVKWFHQGENKQARILSNATNVVNCVYFPVGWQNRWPEFRRDISALSRMSKWVHDDAPDMLTGIVEKSLTRNKATVPARRPVGL
jgi:predicted phage terminase large subunit-like protein